MVRLWIVNAGLDVAFFEKLLELITALTANDIHVVHPFRPVALGWGMNDVTKPLIVSCRYSSPIFIESIQMLQHHAANRSVDFVEAHIVARKFVVVFSLASMVAQHPQPLSHLRIVGCDAAAVAQDGQVFRRKETER